MFETFWQDVRYAERALRRSPLFTLTAVATLALGIGAMTAIFSVVYAVVLQPFPFADPERVVVVGESVDGQLSDVSGGNFNDWRDNSTSFERLAAFHYTNANVAVGETPERIVAARTTHDFFDVFGIRPLHGRTYTADEDRPGREQVVVLSHRFWVRRFASRPDVVGSDIRLDGLPYSVIGVMSPEFDRMGTQEEVWIPVAFTPARLALHDEHFLTVVGRLRPGVTLERANAELQTIHRRMEQQFAGDNQLRAGLAQSFVSLQVGDAGARLSVLLGAVTLVLLIACLNVAHLLLARGGVRSHEIAVRAALGAGQRRLVRQLLTEAMMLAFLGGAVGLLFVYGAMPAIVSLSPQGFNRFDQVGINGPVLLFALCAAIVSALVFGVMPALQTARPDLVGALKESGRTAAVSRARLRTILVAAEVSISIVLLVGAGLLVRSAINLQRVDTGFNTSGVLSARVTLPTTGYEDPSRVARTFETLAETLAASSSVEAAAITSNAPMTPGGNANGLVPEGKVFDPNDFVLGRLAVVTRDYFRVMRIPLVAGRLFLPDDRRGAPLTMVLSETAARLLFPGQDAVGKRVACCEPGPSGAPSLKLVVGIVGDVRNDGPQQAPLANFYLPIAQAPNATWNWIQRSMTLVVRGRSDDAAALTGVVRNAVQQMDATVPLYNVATMQQRLQATLAPTRFNTVLMLLLGTIGLFLAAIGVYGVVAFFVAQRQRDLAIRIALGAGRGNVVRGVVGQGMKPVLAGVAIGLAGAVAASRVLGAYVFGIGTTDPLTLTMVVAVLLVVGLIAAALPAMRAARVDPITALRAD